MSKRDDDSQTDMEAGMTTAERRRRRRRGGGLRVPSDNVPRTAKPPVVAPVPEDPSLAMSIAYSFSPDGQDPATTRSVTRESQPIFEPDAGMSQVIDSVSGPVEQADFETKTREMTAVDLEALGLDEPGMSSRAIPRQRVVAQDFEPVAPLAAATSPGIGAFSASDSMPSIEISFGKREATDPSVDLDISERTLDSSSNAPDTTDDVEVSPDDDDVSVSVDPEPEPEPEPDAVEAIAVDEVSSAQEVNPEDVSVEDEDLGATDEAPALQAGRVAQPVNHESSQRQAMPVLSQIPVAEPAPVQARTVSHEPLPSRHSITMPPLTEALSPSRVMTPPAATPVVHEALAFRNPRAQTVALSEEDLEEVREAARLASQPVPTAASAVTATSGPAASASAVIAAAMPQAPSRPTAMSMPPPMPPKDKRPSEVHSVPELDLAALAESAADSSGDFEVDVEGIVDAKSAPIVAPQGAQLSGPVVAPPMAAPSSDGRARTPSSPPPMGLGAVSSLGAVAPLAAVAPLGAPISVHPSTGLGPRDSQQMAVVRDPSIHSTPPPTPVAHKAPPSPPPKKDKPAAVAAAKPSAETLRADAKAPRGKPWFVDLFDEDYLRTLPFLTPQATQAEAEFVINAMGLSPGAQVLDIGCGYGRHAMELAARGFHVVGLDMSTPLLVRGGEEAHRRGLTINFVRGDMRELDFDAQFDGAYCLFSTFGYFDDETNKKTIANIARALRPGGRVLIEILNRDYVIADLPTRVWWEGDGCVVLEEVELNYFSSRIQVNRSVVFDDGRQLEQEISVRAYSLHEVGKLMHAAGFRVLEVSGAYHTRGRFFGNQSRHIIVLAERKDPAGL